VAATIPNQGELKLLNAIKSGAAYNIVLFQNDLTPSATTVYADMTLATFSGYSQGTITWGTPTTDGGGKGSMTATAVTFTHNGGGTSNNIYGYAIVSQDISMAWHLIMIERLSSPPKSMANNGDSITITPTFKGYNP